MPYTRKTKGTNEAPYGFKPDGKPRGKPGRKSKPKKPKGPRKKPGRKARPKSPRDPSDQRSRRVDRGGFKKDGTPMPPMLDGAGKITSEGARAMQKRGGGRPKGSYSLDRIIKDKLKDMRGKGENRETIGDAIIRLLLEQAVKSPMKRLAIARFVTERMDGKAVQPIRDVTPGLRLGHLSDDQITELLAKRTSAPKPDPVPEQNKDASESSPSPPEERPNETQPSADAPPPPKPQPKPQPTKKKAGSSGLSS